MTLARQRPDDETAEDEVVRPEGATWAACERLLHERGRRSAPRSSYREGGVEVVIHRPTGVAALDDEAASRA